MLPLHCHIAVYVPPFHFAQLKVPANQGGGKVEFRKILLNSCQRVFEKDDVTRASVYQVYEDVRKRAKEEPDVSIMDFIRIYSNEKCRFGFNAEDTIQ